MTIQNHSASTGSARRFSGWTAVLSGLIGIIAFGFLIGALVSMFAGERPAVWEVRFAIHDAGVILQSLLMIPAAFALHALGRPRHPIASRTLLAIGVASLCFIVLCLSLDLAGVIWNAWYMVPQGILGVWLLVVARIASLSRGLTRFATVVGLGLILVGSFPLGFAMLVDPVVFHGSPSALGANPEGTEAANRIIHIILQVGSLIGVWTYPIWSILLGRTLLQRHK